MNRSHGRQEREKPNRMTTALFACQLRETGVHSAVTLLAEYGPPTLDLGLRLRAHAAMEALMLADLFQLRRILAVVDLEKRIDLDADGIEDHAVSRVEPAREVAASPRRRRFGAVDQDLAAVAIEDLDQVRALEDVHRTRPRVEDAVQVDAVRLALLRGIAQTMNRVADISKLAV